MKHLRCQPSPFGPQVVMPTDWLNGAGAIILARSGGLAGLRPFKLLLPGQVYVKDLDRYLDEHHDLDRYTELWALPVGGDGVWLQIAGPNPGTTNPATCPPRPFLQWQVQGRRAGASAWVGIGDETYEEAEAGQTYAKMTAPGPSPLGAGWEFRIVNRQVTSWEVAR